MAQIQESGGPGSRSLNVELNIVPFIDLMSCLTAFLLVTAVWVHISRLDVAPAGKARDGEPCPDDECPPKLSVLVEDDEIWVGVSRLHEFQRIPRLPGGAPDGEHDYAGLERALRAHKGSALFQGTTAIEIAAASTAQAPVRYQALVAAMDVAVRAGFIDVGLSDPEGLSARPRL